MNNNMNIKEDIMHPTHLSFTEEQAGGYFPHTRLYGYKMNEYMHNSQTLQHDLPHRTEDWDKLSQRLGWITWENIKKVSG